MSQNGSGSPKLHSHNTPGDFYIEDDCCIYCGVMHGEAPDLFGWASDLKRAQCTIVKQPASPDEMGRMLRAMLVSDVGCLRYRGNNSSISRRIAEMGEAVQCNLPPPADAVSLIRSHVTFGTAVGVRPASTMDLAQGFIQHDRERHLNFLRMLERLSPNGRHTRYDRHVEAVSIAGCQDCIQISWSTEPAKVVCFERQPGDRWLVVGTRHVLADRRISFEIEDWLRSNSQLEDVRWFSADQWRVGGPYLSTVV